jgi:hypothetical protein
MKAAPMHLYCDVEALIPQGFQGMRSHGGLGFLSVRGADAANRRQDDDAVDGSWATGQQLLVQRAAE